MRRRRGAGPGRVREPARSPGGRLGLANQVAIIGTGIIRFEEKFHPSYTDMVNSIVDQLLGCAGRMQVPGARTGQAHTLDGPDAVSCVAVLGQP
jgi:hypothetical protein